MTIVKLTRFLSDGSEVHDVELRQDGQCITLHTYGRLSAEDLITRLRYCITQYTCDSVALVEVA